jgi:Asp-tRNA(Asn)/Glu-tRNA(Gln) amidotransferase A subunit family amidase
MHGRLARQLFLMLVLVSGMACAHGGALRAQHGAIVSGVASPAVNPVEFTVEQIQADYAARKYTSVQLTQAFLDRIERYEEKYNAFVSMNPNALAQARELDEEFARSGPRGPLHGVPVVVKDNIDYGGLVTTAGFSGFSSATGGVDMIPAHDAAVVERLKAAGAIVLGKTNMPDFAGNGTHTRSSVAGVTLNPYALDRVPGGSSGGTATAVNASFAVLGLGTETGGSIQNPSAAQALVGVKPSFGLVPTHGVVPIDATYKDVVGPLARSVRDAAIAMDVLAGPTPKDLATYAVPENRRPKDFLASLNAQSLAGKRFGLVGPGWRTQFLPLAPETEKVYREAIEILKSRGAEVVEDPFLNSGWVQLYRTQPRGGNVGAHDMFVYMQSLGEGAAFRTVQEWETLTGRTMAGRRGPGARSSATEAGDAFQAWRRDMRALFRKVMSDNRLDGLFFPQAGSPIMPLVMDPARPDATPNNHPEIPSNIIDDIGLPTVTVPFRYYEDGTPFVLALIGDMWSDVTLLSFAYDFEQATRARVAPKLVEPAVRR